jgi:hypothetical protein
LDTSVVLGSDLHGDVIVEACLAKAEQRRDDQLGLHSGIYEQMLRTALLRDADQYGGVHLGYNGDRSERAEGTWPSNPHPHMTITHNP